MSYTQLYELLPDIAAKETRTVTVFISNKYNVPPGDYGLVEMYCDDADCDCHRVLLAAISSVTQIPAAYIYYGWKSKSFYTKWFNRGRDISFSSMDDSSRQAVNYMCGIHLSTSDYQSDIASAVLKMVKEVVLTDKVYVNRLKNHYKLFRAKVDERYRDPNITHSLRKEQ